MSGYIMDLKLEIERMGMEQSLQTDSSPMKILDTHSNRYDGNKDSKDEKIKKESLERYAVDPAVSGDYYDLHLCRNQKIRINKSLFTFRITLLIWNGGGVLPSLFLGIFLKERGLSLVELSSVFSAIFLFQFACCSITGVIADKIGNAKPVMMFLLFSSFLVLLSMLLTPNINSISCISRGEHINNSDVSELRRNFSSCYMNCLFSYNMYASDKDNDNESSKIEHASHVDTGIHFKTGDYKNTCNFYDIRIANISVYSLKEKCCNACKSSDKIDCVTVRNGYFVAVYAILILAFYCVYSTTYRFMNFNVASLSVKNDSNCGKEFAMARTAELLCIIIIVFVLGVDKSSGSDINFDPVIWVATGVVFSAFLASFATTIPILPPGKDLTKKAFHLMRDTDTLSLLLLVFTTGNGFALYMIFHLVIFEMTNAPSIVVTLHSLAIVLYGIPVLFTYKWWLNKLGTDKIFVLALLLYGVNYAAYSYIINPWWFLIIDICAAFIFDLYWVAVVEHCWNIAPTGFAATYMTVTGTVKFGMGRSSGVFFGGMLINYVGVRKAYRIIAGIYFVAAILYSIFVYKRCRPIVPK